MSGTVVQLLMYYIRQGTRDRLNSGIAVDVLYKTRYQRQVEQWYSC